METLIKTESGKSYWDGNGVYQKEYTLMYDNLVKPSGSSDTLHGELIRAISRLQHEYCNNGNCNACNVEMKQETELYTCSECNGSGEVNEEICNECCGSGEIEESYEVECGASVSQYYSNFLHLIEVSIPSCEKEINAVCNIICENLYSIKEQFSENRMKAYTDLFDRVMHFVLTTEDKEIPSTYTKD